jgi:SAM-dependent methyltransferase
VFFYDFLHFEKCDDLPPERIIMSAWPHRLYLKNAAISQSVLENDLKKSPMEVQRLIRLFRQFRVPRHGRILDVSCGIGRHSVYLAKHGYNVVGYDPSPQFLERARELAERLQLRPGRIRFYCGEPKNIASILKRNYESEFDAVISMNNSFGYSTRHDDLRLFRDLHRLAKSNGLLVIETVNREFWIKHFQKFWYESFPKRIERLIVFNFDRKHNLLKMEWTFYKRLDSHDLKYLLSIAPVVRVYSAFSLARLLRTTCWRSTKSFENLARPKRITGSLPFYFIIARNVSVSGS